MVVIINMEKSYYEKIKDRSIFGESLICDEGFIHACFKEQFHLIAPRFKGSEENYIVMEIDTDKLISEVRLEFSSSLKQDFPHIYGRINKEAVVDVISMDKFIQ